MDKKVSVIIPVYKVEKYLDRCVESVLRQTMEAFEVILVNDGSPDLCPQMCDNWAKKDPRIKVIHKKNGGLASARNAGMKIAEGEYIAFVDSDDWIEANLLEKVIMVADAGQYDFVRFRPLYAGWPDIQDGTICDFGTEGMLKDGAYTKKEIREEIYPYLFATRKLTLGPIVAAWRSIYRRVFLQSNEIYFDEEVKYSEDTIFSARVVKCAEKMYYMKNDGLYYYFYNNQSITKKFKDDRWEIAKKLIMTFEKYFREDEEYDFSNQLALQKLYGILNSLGDRKNIKSVQERYLYCKKIVMDPVTRAAVQNMPDVDVSIKLKIVLALIKLKAVRALTFV